MAAYRLSPLAESDLESIWRFTIENWSIEQADIYVRSFFTTFENLASGARKGRTVGIRDGYLKYTVGRHVVYFRTTGNGIDVIRILHQHMDVERHL